jgi:hypothetical protein
MLSPMVVLVVWRRQAVTLCSGTPLHHEGGPEWANSFGDTTRPHISSAYKNEQSSLVAASAAHEGFPGILGSLRMIVSLGIVPVLARQGLESSLEAESEQKG